jgi:hypothetical protein
MAKAKSNTNTDILRYALTHLELERDLIQEKIDHINGQLGNKVSAPAAAANGKEAAPRKKRTLSASARKRIAAAQKKRWAEHRKTQAKAAKAE